MRFTKMHGLGNDFIVLDAVADPAILRSRDARSLAAALCDRRFGVGADGVIVVSRPDAYAGPAEGAPDVAMRIINSDGSDAEICGNGVRCVARLAVERGYAPAPIVRIRTALALLPVTVELAQDGSFQSATVDMGPPRIETDEIPVRTDRLESYDAPSRAGVLAGFRARFVSMGNPHAVLFADSALDQVPLEALGPVLERHAAFPSRANIQFVDARAPGSIRVRTWERGAGATLACGTGACASVVAACLEGRQPRESIAVRLPGGELRVRWDERSGHVFKSGPADEIYTAERLDGPPTPAPHAEETIETPRLVLRPMRRSDAPAIQEFCSERELARFTSTVPHPYPPGAALEHLARVMPQHARGDIAAFAITLKPTGAFIGNIGLRIDRQNNTAEIGYYVGKPHRGAGHCTEATRALAEFGLRRLGLRRVFAHHRGQNPASGRVLAKAGFQREGLLRSHALKWGEPDDIVVYGLTADDLG